MSEQDGLEQSFQAALAAAKRAPDSDDAWDHVEDLADQLQRPEEVGQLYRQVLEGELSRELFRSIAERAVQFHEEWFGEEPEVLTSLLGDIIDRDPEAEWAFERVTMLLTAGENWSALLSVYDRALRSAKNPDVRGRLLEDAAQVAKDFADMPDKAADYMRGSLELDPENEKLAGALERLLERQERWDDLLSFWRGRLDQLSAEQVRATRVSMAALCLDRLESPERALEELQTLLSEAPGHADGCRQVERVLSLESATAEQRTAALDLLRKHYEVAQRPEDVIRVVEQAIEVAGGDDPAQVVRLHREAANRLSILGREQDAIEHFAALLRISSDDADARKQIRHLAGKTGRHDLHAASLVAAADAATDPVNEVAALLEAADIQRRRLDDVEGSITLYRRILQTEGGEDRARLVAAHHLNELFAATSRNEERLDVLERLARLEPAADVRRVVLGEAARLAQSMGDAERALENWRPRLETEPPDIEALSSVAGLLEAHERWEELVQTLDRRAQAEVLPQQRRADLVRMAAVYADKLDDPGKAIDVWMTVRSEFGEDGETLDALEALLESTGRWAELTEILGGTARLQRERAGRILGRLGDVYRMHLDDPAEAVEYYAKAVRADPTAEVPREGLKALIDHGQTKRRAAESLARAYHETEDWHGLLGLVEARVESAQDDRARVFVLKQSARLFSQRASNDEGALEALCKALPLEPTDVEMEEQLLDFAQKTGRWEEAATALSAAAEASIEQPKRSAALSRQHARVADVHLNRPADAVASFLRAEALDPGNIQTLDAIARSGAQAQRWESAADAFLRVTAVRHQVDEVLLTEMETGAGEDLASLAGAFEVALGGFDLAKPLEAMLWAKIADWRKRGGDTERAEYAAKRAVKLAPGDRRTLVTLVELQRREPSPALVETLLLLSAGEHRSVDHIAEAARVALEVGYEHADDVVEQALDRANMLWFVEGESLDGETQPSEVATWAISTLVDRHQEAGRTERAVATLEMGARLPLDDAQRMQYQRRAAELLAAAGETDRAIALYQSVLDARRDDLEVLRRLAQLCQERDRISELLELRERELQLTTQPEDRLELRLEISRLSGVLEERGGRVRSLRVNLQEAPGHQQTLDTLSGILEERGNRALLAEVLTEQGRAIADNEPERGAKLLGRAAKLHQTSLGDPETAIALYEEVVGMAADPAALDALAKLSEKRGDFERASHWLSIRLESAQEKERVAVLIRLARAYQSANNLNSAIRALETAFEEAPKSAEVRKSLIALHRQREDWQGLARTLSVATEHVTDRETLLAYAREAADLYHGALNQPERAVPVLEKAVSLLPEDRRLRAMLAEGLREEGRLDEAGELLDELIGGFGRRRSPERAAAHLELARVRRAQGRMEEAIDQLDTASKMDPSNIRILKTLAELARENGELDRAERAYRTLLMTVRRAGDDVVSLGIGPAGALLELSRIAQSRGQDKQAEELLESALESLVQDDTEAPVLQATVSGYEDWPTLERVLMARLAAGPTSRKRARILTSLARLLEERAEVLENAEARALDARLEAVEADPASPEVHQAAWDRAEAAGQLDRYAQTLEGLLEHSKRDADALVRVELLLRLGELQEREHENYGAASDLYERAQGLGVRQVDVWRARARVAGLAGDTEAQMHFLERLSNVGEGREGTRSDALFRMAEVLLADADSIEDGISRLREALDASERVERGAMVLEKAVSQHPTNRELLDVYEQVARQGSDEGILFHYLKTRAEHVDATIEQVREAVEKAQALEKLEPVEALLGRAVALADDMLDGRKRIGWALLGLARIRLGAGDLAGSVKWLGEAAEVAEREAVFALGEEIAQQAEAPGGDLTLAARLYERLLERDATAREAWQRLADIYGKLGDVERLERVVEETLDALSEAADRNALRFELAKALMKSDGREDDAVAALKDILLEDPTHGPAQQALAEYLERSGDQEALIELLRGRLLAAQGQGDHEQIREASLALGERLRETDPNEAINVIRDALAATGDDADLLRTLIELDDEAEPSEVFARKERLLNVSAPDEAAALTLELCDAYDAAEDSDGATRVLEAGMARAPGAQAVRDRLVERYRASDDFKGLQRLLAEAAERQEDPGAKLSLLREAAAVTLEQLGDPAGARTLLAQAAELAPHDTGLKALEATAAYRSGDLDGALVALETALEVADEPDRPSLLVARARMRRDSGDRAGARVDLESAYAIAPAAAAPALIEVLQDEREAAAQAHELEAERAVTMTLIELMTENGAPEEARELLEAWTERDRKDVDALAQLIEIDRGLTNWEGVTKASARLVALSSDEQQVQAALTHLEAHEQLGQIGEARRAVVHARRKQPESVELREALKRIFEATEAHAELAELSLEEADGLEGEALAEALEGAGRALLAAGEATRSAEVLLRVLEVRPGDPEITAVVASAYIDAGDLETAERVLDDGIAAFKGRRSPEVAMFLQRKALVAARRGDRAGQLKALQQAQMADKRNGHICLELADLAESLEEWDVATKALRSLGMIEEGPLSRAQVFLRQGQIAHRMDDRQRAVLWARRARTEDPETEGLNEFLALLEG